MDEIRAAISSAKKIVIITGAGVSVSGGIPDFRSPLGLYSLVKEKYPEAVLKGQEFFDASLFRDKKKTKLFYHFMASLKAKSDGAQVTSTHTYFNDLEEKGKLMRLYTQNIDDLDKRSGLKKVVQLHGHLETVGCTLCNHSEVFSAEIILQFDQGEIPVCPNCQSNSENRLLRGKRGLSCGFLRPNIVLYNEHHKDGDDIGKMQASDLKRGPDMLIVVGTSLKIVGVKRLIKTFSESIHSRPNRLCVLINMTKANKEWDEIFDYQFIGECDEVFKSISSGGNGNIKDYFRSVKSPVACKKEEALSPAPRVTKKIEIVKKTCIPRASQILSPASSPIRKAVATAGASKSKLPTPSKKVVLMESN